MNQKKKKYILAALTLVVLLGGVCCKDAVISANAKSDNAFSIIADVLPSDMYTYDIRMTVENQGADWEGVVRVEVNEGYKKPTAYDTALSLPQGSKKQFVVSIPAIGLDPADGTVTATLLDRKGIEVQEKVFSRLLVGQIQSLSMGILSDAYSDLTYLDMGGTEIYYYDDLYPIKLMKLQQGSLEDELDALTFLVIDQYNTDILTSDERQAIESWNLSGGVLILGTGAYAEDTLGGFDSGYPGIGYSEIPAPEDGDEESVNMGTYVDLSQLTTVELQQMATHRYNSVHYDDDLEIWYGSIGGGSVCALTYSLAELGREDAFNWSSAQESFVQRMLDEAGDYAASRYSSSSSWHDAGWNILNMLGTLGNSNSILNFGILKGIVIVYVISVGPLLYLLLRLMKRRELYWFAVPATAVLGILFVFLAGRGFEVVSTKVYSVTMKDLSDNGQTGAYLYCYDANRKEWDLKLAEDCEYAGAFYNASYPDNANDDSYFYHIQREGDTFYVGVDPDSNFEDSYFYVGRDGSGDGVEGSFAAQDIKIRTIGISGTIVNETNRDMDYVAVLFPDELLCVYENFPAGASIDLQEMHPVYYSENFSSYGSYYSYYSSYVYDFLWDFREDKEYDKVGELAALGVGIQSTYPMLQDDEIIIIGVTDNWDKVVDDDCSEISYGCLYSIQ